MSRFGKRGLDTARREAAPAALPLAPPRPPAAAPPVPAALGAERDGRLRDLVLERIDPVVAAELSYAELREQVDRLVHELAGRERIRLTAREQSEVATELTNEMIGFGPLEPLLQDDRITEIMVNGPERVFIEVDGRVRLSGIRFRDSAQVAGIAQKMASAVGRRVDESSPLVDCRLADGSRVNVVLPPLAIDGPCISIRKFSRRRYSFEDLVRGGSMTAPVARLLEIAARCALNVIISGGTGSGKTTLLNAMSQLIDQEERIVTIEDAAELQLQQPHVVRLETRPPNLEGRGEVTQRDLLKNALRMRPDRIILGEVRGAEAFDMLQAMNTGHDGSICTVHANNTREALFRVESMVQMGVLSLSAQTVRMQIASAVNLVIQVERMRDGQRRVTQVSELRGMEGEVITVNEVCALQFAGEDSGGRLLGRYESPRVRPRFIDRLEYFGLDRAWMEALQAI